jgi:hypothetical protein
MGYQECFVLPQADQAAAELVNLMRNQLNSEPCRTYVCPAGVVPVSEAGTQQAEHVPCRVWQAQPTRAAESFAYSNVCTRRFRRFHTVECPGISTFTCPINCTVYPESEARTAGKGQELVLSLGNRREQVDLFKELGLQWMYLDEIRGPEEIRGENLFKKYEQYSEVSEEQ